jgi:hypothetical protein
MDAMPPLAPGFVRLELRLTAARAWTPGELAQAAGVALEEVGHILVAPTGAFIDVRAEVAIKASTKLNALGPVRVADWNWQWLRLSVGRNHGLTIGQFKKVMTQADAMPLGRISINNTHTLVGIQGGKIDAVLAKLATMRVNGYAVRPERLAKGPGSPAFVRG